MELVVGDLEAIRRTRILNEQYSRVAPQDKPLNTQINSRIIKGHRLSVNYCQFLNEDRFILSCSDDKTTKLWSTTTSKCIETFQHEKSKAIRKAHVNPNNCEFVNCGDDKRILYWDMEHKQMIWSGEHKGIVMDCRVSHNGKLLASCSDLDNQIKIWDRRAPKAFNNLQDFHKKTSTCLRFTQEDDKIVSTSFDGTTSIFDLRTNRAIITLTGHKNIVSCCALTLNDHFLVTGGWDKILNIWDIAIGKYRTAGPISLQGHEGSISCCVFGLEGKWLVTGGYDNLIILWDLTEYREQYRLTEHINWIHSVDIAKSQRSILSCSRDRTIRVWDIDNISSISALLPGNDFIPRVLQCERCNKTFIPLNDYQNTMLLLCTYCKLDSCLNKYSL
ncbi:repeat-containing 88-like [Octopus vulgaris]|uniref:Repeat-containing 88-like n=1 Tax=Octopus vulgaris TaxID=6645 RepID=A0AA36EX13_OCTVU|nr:repeat-containing 88-like [Octopus vulgaris]